MKGYLVYMIIIILITVPIVVAPIFLHNNSEAFGQVQWIYSYFCHQLTSRSYCFFPENGSIENCYASPEFIYNKEWVVNKEGIIGYKFPVCARDLGFYLFALLGGVFLFVIDKYRSIEVPHPIWLILALIPFALDGGTQFIGLRESTNIIRFITGAIAGFVLSFYMAPLLNRLIK